MDPLYCLQDIDLRLGTHFRLDIPHLRLDANGVYVFTGPNGAGKSTLLRLLSFLKAPGQGAVWFMGEKVSLDPRNLTRLRRQVTLVEQSPYLFAGTVAWNLAYGLKLRGIRSREQARRIESALDMVGLAGFEQRKNTELSGGEVQRVALARALVLNPRVLILDEPASYVDRASLHRIEAVIRELSDQGVTVIMTSHDDEQPNRVGGMVIALNRGRLCEGPKSSAWPHLETITREKTLWPQTLRAQGL